MDACACRCCAPGCAAAAASRWLLSDPLRLDSDTHVAHHDALCGTTRAARGQVRLALSQGTHTASWQQVAAARRTRSELPTPTTFWASRAVANSTKAKPLSLRQCTLRTLPCGAKAAFKSSASALGGTDETNTTSNELFALAPCAPGARDPSAPVRASPRLSTCALRRTKGEAFLLERSCRVYALCAHAAGHAASARGAGACRKGARSSKQVRQDAHLASASLRALRRACAQRHAPDPAASVCAQPQVGE